MDRPGRHAVAGLLQYQLRRHVHDSSARVLRLNPGGMKGLADSKNHDVSREPRSSTILHVARIREIARAVHSGPTTTSHVSPRTGRTGLRVERR